MSTAAPASRFDTLARTARTARVLGAPGASGRPGFARRCVAGAALALGAVAALPAHAAAPVPAALGEARDALASGTVAWDLRASGPLLPGAVRLAPAALAAFVERGDVEALSAAVSAAGLNLSASVLLVADDGATARALAERVAPLARGRVLWLSAGVGAWVAAGLPTVAEADRSRLPLPQRLVAAAPVAGAEAHAALPADAARRGTATFSLAAPVQRVADAGL